MGPPDRPRGPHAPPRGPRGRPPAADRTLPGGAAARAGDDRPRSRVRGARDRADAPGHAQRAPVDGRSVRARRRLVPGALAGPGHSAARSARHGDGDQQRIDRAARHRRRAAVPADRRCGGGNRSDPGRTRAPACRCAQSGPSREPDRDDGRTPQRNPSGRCADLGWGEEHVRAPRAGDPRPAGGPRRPDLPHGPRRDPGRGARRERDQRPQRAQPGAGSGADRRGSRPSAFGGSRRGAGTGCRGARRRRGHADAFPRGIPACSTNAGPGRDRHPGHV